MYKISVFCCYGYVKFNITFAAGTWSRSTTDSIEASEAFDLRSIRSETTANYEMGIGVWVIFTPVLKNKKAVNFTAFLCKKIICFV